MALSLTTQPIIDEDVSPENFLCARRVATPFCESGRDRTDFNDLAATDAIRRPGIRSQ
jgi:hypothetical protein